MKALFYPEFDTLSFTERPEPTAGPGEVLLRVSACGICGSELETFKSHSPRRQPPLIMGHEFCGVIESTGDGVEGWQVGQRVVSNSLAPCGTCVRCHRGDTHLCASRQIFGMHRGGAFAELVNVPASCLMEWPETLAAEAACLAEPLANGVHVTELTRAWAAEKAVVIGAGPIGLMCQQALQALRGSDVLVTDRMESRLQVAKELGAYDIATPAEVEDRIASWTEGEGVDLVVDAAGNGVTKRLSLDLLRPGGATVWIGLLADRVELDSYGITLPEKTVLGTYASRMSEMQVALDLMANAKVKVTGWPTAAPLEAGEALFRQMLAAGPHDLKGILRIGRDRDLAES